MPEPKTLMRVGVVVLALALALLAYLSQRTTRVDTPPGSETDAGRPDAASVRPALVDRGDRHDARPDILLLTIDALRADHVHVSGYDRQTTPTLDGLAERGTRFSRAYSTSSWAVPAVASLLTGVLPAEHGALHARVTPEHMVEQEVISPSLPSLAVALHDAGYRTVGLTASAYFDPAFGYGRGFDDYESLGAVGSDSVLSSLSSRVEDLRAGESPYFLWIHLVDPGVPYTPTEPQFTTWWPATRTRYTELDHAAAGIAITAAILRHHLPPRDALDYVVAAYDSEVRVADTFLGEVLARLDDGHLAVVVTADEGEEFGDHHGMGHGHTLFDEVIHIPLVVALPEQTPSVRTPLVTLMDVFPTLLEIADAPAPSDLAGLSLLPAVRGEAFPETRDVVLQTGGPQVIQGIFDGRYAYGERTTGRMVQGLFDLREDPYEQSDILAAHPEIATPLRQRMLDAIAAGVARRPEVATTERAIPEALREQLEALGYGTH